MVAQFALLALVLFGPRRLPFAAVGDMPLPGPRALLGALLVSGGLLLMVAAAITLGGNLTPLPYPRRSGTLVQSGVYRLVRHPIYGGLVIAAIGWAMIAGSWLTLAYALLLFALLEAKASREERWLEAKYPGYAAYRRRVRKLVPFVH